MNFDIKAMSVIEVRPNSIIVLEGRDGTCLSQADVQKVKEEATKLFGFPVMVVTNVRVAVLSPAP